MTWVSEPAIPESYLHKLPAFRPGTDTFVPFF